jgi:hypothetical protein
MSAVNNARYVSSACKDNFAYLGGVNANKFATRFVRASGSLSIAEMMLGMIGRKDDERREVNGRAEEKEERDGIGRRFGRRGRVRMWVVNSARVVLGFGSSSGRVKGLVSKGVRRGNAGFVFCDEGCDGESRIRRMLAAQGGG